MNTKLLSVREVAERLIVSVGLVYKLVARGDITAYQIASAIRVGEDELESYLKGRRVLPVERSKTRQVKLRRRSI